MVVFMLIAFKVDSGTSLILESLYIALTGSGLVQT
ncbi:hypothetical protein P3TCK_01514 [Photobacterium profundum 3TCK]|uniref:Uncharacterized protein n=1 Tax=Photobacterium profundum 3TCK TaxID=314280 RepID=Q1Z4X8_9GAMM|nr:hypothetical protein P3TCK_01514 [Photobacterium profundum 3TCK]